MSNLLQTLQNKLSKPILFGIYGAIGCFLAALILGEIFLAYTKLPPSSVPAQQAVVLLIDTSSSMSGGKLDEVKAAALGFVQRRDLSRDRLAIVNFGDTIATLAPLASDSRNLTTALSSLSESGGTPMAEGIEMANGVLQATSFDRYILLFTDGQPNSTAQAFLAAQNARNRGITLIAVATGDADSNYLAGLTGDRSLVFPTDSGQFDRAFREAEKVIYSKQLVESGESGDYNLVQAAGRIGGWTALLSAGISLFLIGGQNVYLRRRLLSAREAITIVGGSLLAGFLAGGIGQSLFFGIANLPYPGIVGGILNCTIAGTVVAAVIASRQHRLFSVFPILAGAIGATLSATVAFYLVPTIGDPALAIGAILFGLLMGAITRSRNLGVLAAIASLFLGKSLLFPPFGLSSSLDTIGRVVGWTLLGALLGGGITFVPNLKFRRALLGGALGGSLGAIGFLVASFGIGDLAGRLLGSAILGFCLGMMIFWEEAKQLRSEAHVVVHWGPKETSKILLGERPILLGTCSEAQIPLARSDGYFPVTAKLFQEGNTIVLEYDPEYGQAKGMKKFRQELQNGDRRQLGPIALEIKTSS